MATYVEREPREKSFNVDFDDLALPVIIAGGLVLVAVYKDEVLELITKGIPNFQEFLDSLTIHPLPPIPLPGGGLGPIIGGSGFGSGEVSEHGLDSGGSAWRKQWEVHKRFLNLEFSGYFFIPTSTKRKDGISVKVRGGPHNDSAPKEGCCYIFHLEFDGSNAENFQKECPHPDYSKNRVGVQFNPGNIKGKWTGIRIRTVNQGSGVRCQMWLDVSGRQGANQWKLWYDILDTGQYGSGAQKPPFTKSPVNGNNPQVQVRIDGDSKSEVQGYQMSNARVGEISGSNLAQRLTIA